MIPGATRRRLATLGLILVLAACSKAPSALYGDGIPVAHTPPGGYGRTFPKPVLARCRVPLVQGAPDLRGIWKVESITTRSGVPVPRTSRIWSYVERIEQCGDRIVVMSGGVIWDARADGTEEHGVHDVSALNYKSRADRIALYQDGVFVLKPVLWPGTALSLPWLKMTRQLDSRGRMLWVHPDLGYRAILKRIGGPNDSHTRP